MHGLGARRWPRNAWDLCARFSVEKWNARRKWRQKNQTPGDWIGHKATTRCDDRMIAFFTSFTSSQTLGSALLQSKMWIYFFLLLLLLLLRLDPLRHHILHRRQCRRQRQRRAHTNLCRLTYIIIYCRARCGEKKRYLCVHTTFADSECLRLSVDARMYVCVHRACVCVCVSRRTRHPSVAAAVHQWLKLTSWKDQRWIFKEIFECYRIGRACRDSAISHTNSRHRSSSKTH